MPASGVPAFADRLLDWFDRAGRKDLPWQHPRTPYRVWVSEIMLQQTQVSTVIPYFQRWMETFPCVEDLAAATQDEVLALWSGLGYYARARNLHRAAGECVARHGGEIPLDPGELSSLPGIGPSTANAIISQSTDRPAAVLDGNVRRWLARHTGTEGWPGKTSVQKKLWAEAEKRLPKKRGADYTQAAMDLGALVCTRSNPACDECPVAEDCVARKRGMTASLPSPKPPTRVRDQQFFMLLLADDEGRLLLEKRPGAGIWGGLWCLPVGETLDEALGSTGLDPEKLARLTPFEHRLSHRRLEIHPVLAEKPVAVRVKSSSEQQWFDRASLKRLGLPRPVSELLDRFDNGDLK